MKIAIIGSRGYPYIYSGYETFVTELCERLAPRGYEITVYCHKNLFRNYPESVNGINLVYIPTFEKKTLSQFVHSFQSTLHACLQDYDVILAVNSANGPFGFFTKLFRKKTAINVDGMEWLRPKWKGLGAKYFYTASKLATRLYDYIITDSEEMGKIYMEEFGAPSTVIAYGANIRRSMYPELISKWRLKHRGYYLIVGRLVPDNNADVIVDRFIRSKSRKKLVVVGDVPYNDTFAQNIKKVADERVIFTGYVTDQNELAELYHHCFAYFHGHEFGGTNPTILKALAYGSPILALDTRFTREVLKNGEYGLYFPKKGDELIDLIHKVESDDRALLELSNKSRQRIEENYTWEKITNQYVELFERMVHKDVETVISSVEKDMELDRQKAQQPDPDIAAVIQKPPK